MKKGFTLAELMIVLVVVGVLSAIIMPIAFQSAPDEAALKFRKGYNTLGQAVRELVNSYDYYQEGDLRIMANGNAVSSSTYLCETLADVMNTKSVNCSTAGNALDCTKPGGWYAHGHTTPDWGDSFRTSPDEACRVRAKAVGAEIVGNDDIVWYQPTPALHFTSMAECTYPGQGKKLFGAPLETHVGDQFDYDPVYKVICMDIDGIHPNACDETDQDLNWDAKRIEECCVNECPFGFGIRADGKMMLGARAQAWIEKSVQKGDN
ncbi:MAG: prepilin-type N-terminal cleavage/methylation domain-containing protein [Candidatus Gastranaerophilales bacterium]|nr:prepilin-type N-terminal cleavage/methylation domain-containing protein [Candidatus Gastranaerophilales bacterium]